MIFLIEEIYNNNRNLKRLKMHQERRKSTKMDEVFENLNRSFKNLPMDKQDNQNDQQDAANANNDRSATPTVDLA